MKLKFLIYYPICFTLLLSHCLAQVVGLEGWNICLDPGHSQTENMGIYGYSEAEKNLRVGLFLLDFLLEETDIDTVYITRTNDEEYVTLSQRTDYANSIGTAWFHSIHSDAGPPNYNSTLLLWGELYNGTPDPPVGGEAMSDIITDILTRGMRTTTRGSWGDCSYYTWSDWCQQTGGPYLWVNRMTNMPSELSEAGFHTNPTQNQLNMNSEWKKLEAMTFYWSLLKYHNIERPFVGTCTGIISDVESNIPINGAVVSLQEKTYSTDSFESLFHNYTSDPDLLHNGFYYFDGLSNDTLQMTIEAANYYPETLQVAILDTFFTFKDVQLLSNTPPTIVNTLPAEGDTNTPAWDPIMIEFSRPMAEVSVETTLVTEPEMGGVLAWSDDSKKLIFNADTLQFETNYVLTITGDAQDQYGHFLDGNGDGIGGDDFILSFRTGPPDMSPPELLSIYPPINSQDVERNPIVNMIYDEELDPTSISDTLFKLERYSDYTEVQGILEHYVMNDQSVLCYFPSDLLFADEIYVSRISPGLRDLFGNENFQWKAFPFVTTENTFEITTIDDYESGVISNWWAPQMSGSTTGIITDSTGRSVNSNIVNLLTGSTQSLQVDYGWDTNVDNWLIRVYLSGGTPREVWFDSDNKLQIYIFGDGSGNQFRFCVDDKVPNADAANHEVSPWYTIDWIGWKLISWDMMSDGTGTWIGDGNLDGTLRIDSIQLTYFPGNPPFGTLYFDDLHLAEIVTTNITEESQYIPGEFTLYPNYPNPFNPNTTIRYDLPQESKVNLVVYDLIGREVVTLVNETQSSGQKLVIWNGRDDFGHPMVSGMYLYRLYAEPLQHGNIFTQSRKMLLLK
ncbi:MAG: Ig-like domain-containing protein [Fidelibacterota bacterium]